MSSRADPLTLRAQPLCRQAFAPFGEVIEHRGDERRHNLETDLASLRKGMRHAIWVSKLRVSRALPVTISKLERHPYSAQAFVPLSGQPFLVVACPNLSDGSPDLSGCQAFVGKPTQGVIYQRNVWHAGLEVFDSPAEFVVVMALADDVANDIFVDLALPIEVEAVDL